MCWKDGFSIKWLASFSLSMAYSQYLCALKTLYKIAFRSLQNGSFWCPKNMMSSTPNGKAFSNPLFTTEWHPPTPFFPQNGGLYEGRLQPFCAGNGQGDPLGSKWNMLAPYYIIEPSNEPIDELTMAHRSRNQRIIVAGFQPPTRRFVEIETRNN